MKREAHYLKSVSGGAIPRSLLSVAAVKDATGKVHHCLRHYDTKNADDAYLDGIEGERNGTLWQLLAEQCKHGYASVLFMMNAVEQLALLGFWDELDEGRWELSSDEPAADQANCAATGNKWQGLCILSDPPTIVVTRPTGTRRPIKILDCRNYGVSNWRSLLTDNVPAVVGWKEATAKAAAIDQFVRQLTLILDTAKLGGLKTTAASQAMHAYRHRFMKGIILAHTNHDALCMERSSVYAGRCECWTVHRKVERLYHLDFNAFYPSVVSKQPLPARFAGITFGCVPNPVQLRKDGYLCIAEVTVETDQPCYPLRYLRSAHVQAGGVTVPNDLTHWPRDGDVIYPVGLFSTVLCGPELDLAYSREDVRLVHAVARYEPSELFTKWSEETGQLETWCKQHACRGVVEFVKRLRNSLFGKFCQRGLVWQNAPWQAAKSPYATWYGLLPDSDEVVRYRAIADHVQVERSVGDTYESVPAITAWVYSLARMKLWRSIEIAGCDNVHYMDTDSLWVNHDGFTNLESAGMLGQNEPGKLKIEAVHSWVNFHGIKQYECDGKSVHAGVPAAVDGNWADGWRYLGPERTMPAVMHGRRPCEGEVVNVVKPSGGYRHGRVTVGGRVLPHELRMQ